MSVSYIVFLGDCVDCKVCKKVVRGTVRLQHIYLEQLGLFANSLLLQQF